jgi:hypothetical protein
VNELDDSPARDPPVCPQKHRNDRSLGMRAVRRFTVDLTLWPGHGPAPVA